MIKLTVPFLSGVCHKMAVDELLAAMLPLPGAELKEVPWSAFPYRPLVRIKIAHTATGILLLYEVREKHVRAVYRNTNDPVYKDSCVEFFLSFDGLNYYNMEFNCIGTGLIGYGPARKSDRQRLPAEVIEQVNVYSSIAADKPRVNANEWQLLLQIPYTVFEADEIDSLAGRCCTANFYKCGDDLPEPHYVAWSGIAHPTPNFHLPQYFGELCFQKIDDKE